MALSPGIPTSFVPRPQTPTPRANAADTGTNWFLIIASTLLVLTITAAGGIFFYDKYLVTRLNARQELLTTAGKGVDKNQVNNFIRLRDRLVTAKSLLDNHTTLSSFFDAIESVTLQNVQLNTLTVTVAGDHSAKVEISGTAKNYNTLASQANTLASQKHIRRAIFSGITLDKITGNIGFNLKATVDPELVIGGTTTSSLSQVEAVTVPVPTFPASTQVSTSTASTAPSMPTMPTTPGVIPTSSNAATTTKTP